MKLYSWADSIKDSQEESEASHNEQWLQPADKRWSLRASDVHVTDSDVLKDQGFTIQFNHQIDQGNTQTWSEPLLCLSSNVLAGWHLTTHSNFTPRTLLCRACHDLACQCLLQLCAQYLSHLIFKVAVLLAAQAACVLSTQQGPSRPGGTLLGDLGFQSTIVRLPRFVQLTLCSPELWEGGRKKAISQARLAFFDSFEQTNTAKKHCRWSL